MRLSEVLKNARVRRRQYEVLRLLELADNQTPRQDLEPQLICTPLSDLVIPSELYMRLLKLSGEHQQPLEMIIDRALSSLEESPQIT